MGLMSPEEPFVLQRVAEVALEVRRFLYESSRSLTDCRRIHSTLRMTPAMAAGIADRLYDLDGLLDMVDEVWSKPNRPKRYRRRDD